MLERSRFALGGNLYITGGPIFPAPCQVRSRDASCNRNSVDPSALATFGVYAPETKRIIHVREVFR